MPKAVIGYVAKYGAEAAGLVPGQQYTTDELLHIMLVMSAADAAYTLANAYGPGLPAFIAKMNVEASNLGLANTHFTSPDGLPYPTEFSTYSAPADLVTLGQAAMQNPVFRSIADLKFYNLPKGDGHNAVSATSDDVLLGSYAGGSWHQNRLHQRRRPHLPLRSRPQRPHPHRRRPRLPGHQPLHRLPGRHQDPQLGLRPQPIPLTHPAKSPPPPTTSGPHPGPTPGPPRPTTPSTPPPLHPPTPHHTPTAPHPTTPPPPDRPPPHHPTTEAPPDRPAPQHPPTARTPLKPSGTQPRNPSLHG